MNHSNYRTIKAPVSKYVRAHFMDFDTEKNVDEVTVEDSIGLLQKFV